MPDYPSWIPDEIAIGYIEHGIQALLPWQLDVLNNQALRAPKYENFIFSAPTSSGKTIVAELIAVNTVQQLRCKAVFVFPYISVAKEKFLSLQKIWRKVDLRVSAFIGSHSSAFQAWDASICTIEKANSLLNRMIDDKTIFEIGILVIDEFHMLFDSNRGALVEHIVGKALYISRFLNHRIQIVGLSATLPNLDELADWLNAEKYETQFRPIQLLEMIMCDNQLRDVNTLQCIRTVSNDCIIANDVEHTIIHLCTESVVKDESVLVFCSSKTETEKLALSISHHFDECSKLSNNQNLISSLNVQSLQAVKQAFHCELQFVDDILQKTISYGIAFHHAGLTMEERESIENAFHEQLLHVVCATSTLSSGINLPAHRVIIKAQMCGPVALNGLTYMQMIGRAGRLGQTDKGESIVVCSKNQLDLVQRIIQQKAIFARRCEIRRRRIKLIIEAICSGLCKNENDLENLLSLLFFERRLTIKEELNFLISKKLIGHKKNFELCGTQLGQAVFISSLSPDIALQVYDDLEKAMHSLALDNELHLIYLVTPLHNDSIWMNYIDWNVYYNIWSKLPSRLQRVGKMIGICDSFILGKIQGRQASETGSMQVHLRFLSALALFDLIRECSLGDVARRFHINRGTLQTLQQQSATYAYMVVTFCDKLGWIYLRSVLDGFSERLTFGIRKDLTELVQIDGIDGKRARAFHNANITTIPTLAITSIDDITKILRSVVSYVKRDNNEGLNRWLAGEGLMTDVEAAQILIQRARLHLSSSLRAIGIFSDEKINSLFSNATMNSETSRYEDNVDVEISKYDDNTANPNCIVSDVELTSLDIFKHENFTIKNTCKNSEEQSNTESKQNQKSKVIEKRPPKMTLLESQNCLKVKQTILNDKENLNIMDSMNDVEQLCTNFANSSMSDETLLRFACSYQYSDKVTQTLDAITLLANNEKFDKIKYEMEQDEFTDVKFFESFDILNSTKNEIKPIPTTTATVISTEILDNAEKDEDNYLLNPELIKSSAKPTSALSSTVKSVESPKQSILESIEEEREIVANSSASIENRSILDQSNDLFDRTFSSSISSQSFNHRSQNSSFYVKRRSSIPQRSSINQSTSSSKSPNFQSPQHKILKLGSPCVLSLKKEIKFNESIKNDIEHFDSNQIKTTTTAMEFQIIDVCGSRPVWEQFMTRQKYWREIGLGIATLNNSDIIGIALCALNDHDCFYIDLKRKNVSEIKIEKRLEALYDILKSEQQQKYIYDLLSFSRLLRHLQDASLSAVLFNCCFCVQTISYLAHYHTMDGDSAFSFQDLLSRLTSPERAVIFKSATPRVQAAISAFICLHMYADLLAAAIRLSSSKSVQLEIQSVILFNEIETIGIAFNVNEAKTLISKLKQKLTEIEAEAHDIAGISFNFASASEISQVLYVHLKIPPPNITTGRHYSTSKIALQQLAPKYPIIRLILEWRRINTALTTSLPTLVKSCCSDERIHANFTTYCRTGRVLTVHPNVQNVQKDALIDGFSIRSLFIAPKGRILLSADYRQLEMRMLAHLSTDPQLISLFLCEGDFFEIMAMQWTSNNEMLPVKMDRKKVKQICYGIIYGMGATSLSKELGVQKQYAQQMIRSFFQQFPKVRTWMDKILAACRINGYVSTLLGRRRFLPQITGMLQEKLAQAERQAINTCIQGSVSELFKMALLNLHKNLLGSNSSIVMQMHDEVLVETDECSVVLVAGIIKNSMITVLPNLRVPLAVKISSGKNWGELQEYSEF